MTTTATTQENKVTEGITITPAEVREGDKIAVTLHTTSYEDREHVSTYTGMAHSVEGKDVISGKPVWRTEKGWNLYVHEEGAVIELLERPEPKSIVPTLPNAIVKYNVASFDPDNAERTAIRDGSGTWKAYDPKGDRMDTHFSDADFSKWLTDGAHPHEVVFGGTK